MQFLPYNSLNERQGGYVPGSQSNVVPFNGTNGRSSGAGDSGDDSTTKLDERLRMSPYSGAAPLGSNHRGIQRFSSL
jgi:hypothetical protein